ncbi:MULTISPECIES: hypothetical protein [Rhizobium]|uniref:Uncharacterized protein n=1 Tax=Rhizobium leguminosarum TaxID=384 RepID=A0A7W9ZYN9_RHILE|nr:MULTISPECIES: hypothetical protein [Rhizobium]MBB6224513.1 hypothetical protein [Rhizobium leguminosarum]
MKTRYSQASAAVLDGVSYPIKNALSPPATGCDIIVFQALKFHHRKRLGKSGGL